MIYHSIRAKVQNLNFVSVIYPSFQLNISRIGSHLLRENLSLRVRLSVRILIK
jgi:hypothetical protein